MPWLTKGNRVLLGRDYQTSYPTVTHTYVPTWSDKWLATSEGHYGYPDFPISRNVGGPFFLRGAETVHTPSENVHIWRGGPNDQHYDGMFIANLSSYSQPSLGFSDGSGENWAAEAYNKMKPTKPEFSALNAIYELREVPGMLRQRFLKSGLSGIGSYYLALKFGWEPLLRDVRSMVQFQRNAQIRLKQLLRDNGRPVRRRITIFDESVPNAVTSGTLYGALTPILVTQYYASQPTWKLTTYYRETIWASARMKYWLPGGPRDIAWQRKMLARLYGLTPTPSVIYKAIPWSWLIDWFSNVGDLIANLDAGVADRLAADYFYVMRKREWSSERQVQAKFRDKQGVIVPVSASARTSSYLKTRVRGGPFDPSIGESSLNDTQVAILGALGLSRMR